MRFTLLSLMIALFSPLALSASVLNDDGSPRTEVIQIFEKFNPQIGPNPSLADLNAIAQKEFLRPAKSERLSKEAIAHYMALCSKLSAQDKDQIIENFRKIGDIDTVYPTNKNPDYILIQGSTIADLRGRLAFLGSLVNENKLSITPHTQIVFLLGDRKLFDSETKEVLLNPAPFKAKADWKVPENLPTNEMDLGEFAWNQVDLPAALASKTPLFIKAAKKPDAPRAQTEDCVRAFLEQHKIPNNATFLVVSGNPFVYYQKRVTELMFKKLGQADKGYRFEAIGDGPDVNKYDKSVGIGVLMDNLARTLYTEVQYTK